MVGLLYLAMIGHAYFQVVLSEGVFSVECDTVNTLFTVTYENEPGVPATFVYAIDKLSTCSSTSVGKEFTGDGSQMTPYNLTVDPTDSMVAEACGFQLEDASTETYSFSVGVKFGSRFFINGEIDKVYNATCSLKPLMTTPEVTPVVLAEYACDSQKRLHFHYYNSRSTPADIYSVDKRATCSMNGGSGTGNATPTSPFQLIIDVSGTQTPDCGATEVSGEVYEVNILVQSTAMILKADDVIYRVVCNFSETPTELSSLDALSIRTELLNGSATNLIGRATLRVTDEEGNHVTQILLGQSIILQAVLLTTDAASLRLSKCVARPVANSTLEVPLLDDYGCATGDLISSFTTDSGLTTAKTQPFLAFSFDNSDSMIFICQVEFCYGRDVTRCTGSHCSPRKRRKREILNGGEEEVSAYVVFSGQRHSETLGKSGTMAEENAREECNRNRYWIILGGLLGIILLLLLITGSLLFCLIGARKKKHRKQ